MKFSELGIVGCNREEGTISVMYDSREKVALPADNIGEYIGLVVDKQEQYVASLNKQSPREVDAADKLNDSINEESLKLEDLQSVYTSFLKITEKSNPITALEVLHEAREACEFDGDYDFGSGAVSQYCQQTETAFQETISQRGVSMVG